MKASANDAARIVGELERHTVNIRKRSAFAHIGYLCGIEVGRGRAILVLSQEVAALQYTI